MADGSHSSDLRATLALSAEEARTGTIRTLTLPGGRQISVTIPPGVSTGHEIRLEGQNTTTTSGPPGALILSISVASAPGFNPAANQENSYATELMHSTLPPPPPSTAYGSPSPQQVYPQPLPAAAPQYNAIPYQPTYPQTYPPQYPSAPQPARRSPVLVTVLIIVALLVIIGGASAIYVTNVYIPGQIRAQGTATAVAQATSVAQSHANATAQANVTATTQAQATATVIASHQTLFDQTTQKTPDLSDPLQNPSQNNWANTSGSGCSYANNAYHINETKNATILYCTAQNTNFSNFVYSVQMQIIKGDYGGLIFRANAAKSQFYLFRISQSSYDLYYYPDNTGKTAKSLASGKVSTINNQPVNIAVIANGSNFDLFMNGKFIATASDPSLTSGQIGLIANEGDNPTEVAYTNAQVWKLSA